MNATQRAIEDAVKGGGFPKWFNIRVEDTSVIYEKDDEEYECVFAEMLLMPDTWRAIAKTREWYVPSKNEVSGALPEWHSNMYGLIDALVSGSSIEEYFISLETEV